MDAEREGKLYLPFCVGALVVLVSCKAIHWYWSGTVVAKPSIGNGVVQL